MLLAKRGNNLRAQAAATSWGARGARVNSMSPGIIVTPLARHELESEIGGIYRVMVESSAVKRMAPPDEIALSSVCRAALR